MQYYTLDGQCIVLTDDEALVIEAEDVELLGREESDFEAIQNSHMLQTFPEAKTEVKKLLKEMKGKLEEYETRRREIGDNCVRQFATVAEQERHDTFITKLFIDIPEEKLKKDIKRFEQMLAWQTGSGNESLRRAKLNPMTDHLAFNSAGFTECIWHKDKTPSLKYYPKKNRVHCFGCGKTGDVLDVYMQIHEVKLPEAIRALS